jgi:osmotically-inducible protein OsmY
MPAVIDRFTRRDHRDADRATGALAGAALVAGAWFFLDPQQGARRRHAARDRTAAMLRARKREAVRKARYAEGVAQGMAYRAGQAVTSPDADQPQPDDVTLARKVETEIFRPADAPKGQVDVNVDDGVVFLRGTLDDPDKAEDLAAAAGKVGGVREVRNLIQTR